MSNYICHIAPCSAVTLWQMYSKASFKDMSFRSHCRCKWRHKLYKANRITFTYQLLPTAKHIFGISRTFFIIRHLAATAHLCDGTNYIKRIALLLLISYQNTFLKFVGHFSYIRHLGATAHVSDGTNYLKRIALHLLVSYCQLQNTFLKFPAHLSYIRRTIRGPLRTFSNVTPVIGSWIALSILIVCHLTKWIREMEKREIHLMSKYI